jgi:hypothetical protein
VAVESSSVMIDLAFQTQSYILINTADPDPLIKNVDPVDGIV